MNQDPFDQYRINKNRSENLSDDRHLKEIQQKQNSDPFDEYRIKKSESFPWMYETGRHAARTGSRIAEIIGGIPGDVESLIQSGILTGLEKLTGHKLSQEGHEELKKLREPTSSELKKMSEELTGGFTKAQNPTEEKIDEVAQTAASLLGPMKFRKIIGVAVGSQLAKEGLNVLGFKEGTQEAGKLGTMLMLSMINPMGAMKYADLNYKKARKLSEGASISVQGMENSFMNKISQLREGVETPQKTAVIKPMQNLLDKVQNGKLPIHDLTSAKRDLNTLIKDPILLKREKELLKFVGKEIDNAIKPYEKINPEFSKAYRPANELFATVMQGTKARDFVKKWLGAKSIFGSMLAETAGGYAEAVIPTAATMIGIHGAAKTVDFLSRLKSKEARKFYIKGLEAAIKEDVISLRRYEEKLREHSEK